MSMPESTSTDTNAGFIVGADPKQPLPTAAQWADVGNTSLSQNPLAQQPPQPPAEPQGTPEDVQTLIQQAVEAARREEKEKLYGRIETMDQELATIRAEREAAAAAQQAEIAAAAERARLEEEEKLTLKQLVERRDQEWSERFNSLQTQYETDKALFDTERRFQALEEYRQQRIDQEQNDIMPQLRDLIRGNDEAAIEASIVEMKNRTAEILAEMQAAQGQQRQAMRGATPTAPPNGPMEQAQTYESLTPGDIASMDMETYRKHRASLLNAAGRQYTQG